MIIFDGFISQRKIPFQRNCMISYYTERINEVGLLISQLQKKDNIFNTLRLISFVAFLVSISISLGNLSTTGFIISGILLFGFIRVVLLHLNNQEKLDTALTRKKILENEIDCLDLKGNVYFSGSSFHNPDHDYSYDMDLFGEKSIFHYINRSATGVGNKALSSWLADEHPLEEILKRQEAIKELAAEKEWCEDLRTGLYKNRIDDFRKEHLPEIEKTMSAPKNLKTWINLSFGLMLLTIAGISFFALNATLLLIPLFLNSLLSFRYGKFTKTIRAQLEGRENTLKDYHKILTAFESKKLHSAFFDDLRNDLSHDQMSATRSIARLQNLSKKLDYSLGMLIGMILNIFLLWDIVLCRKITQWFDIYAKKTRQWFSVAGSMEAIISLANVRNNHPEWNFPVFQRNGFHLEGKNLGHPLIPEKERVCNDFNLENESWINIITGSNMAGKSTFLRTIGVNIILAKAGSVVCAQSLNISHFRILTYLTITDSLTENTSTFYREILRLKKILDIARQDNNNLLLLDEMLRGTNSADKARGSMAIVRELIRHKVPAIVATHNLELAEMQKEFSENISNYYFDIIIEKDSTMSFDYKLKPGICNTFNASLLLKKIGIDVG
jgi:DNA mismatch repair ATPase MutS